jgi:hypothetical protein
MALELDHRQKDMVTKCDRAGELWSWCLPVKPRSKRGRPAAGKQEGFGTVRPWGGEEREKKLGVFVSYGRECSFCK